MQLLAAIANDAEYMPSLLHVLESSLDNLDTTAEGDVWGVGYYADDRALLIRKPGELLTTRSFHQLASNVKSQVVVAFVNRDGAAPPYRFRRWSFGSVGDLSLLGGLRDKIE